MHAYLNKTNNNNSKKKMAINNNNYYYKFNYVHFIIIVMYGIFLLLL